MFLKTMGRIEQKLKDLKESKVEVEENIEASRKTNR